MTASPSSEKRRVIPRWRTLLHTNTCELASLKKPDHSKLADSDLMSEKMDAWLEEDSLQAARELIFAAAATREAAVVTKKIIAKSNLAQSPILDHVVSNLIRGDNGTTFELKELERQTTGARGSIRLLKERLQQFPRNAFLYVELARQYLILGQLNPAKLAIERACALAPNNRYILRSACRFFVHSMEFDKAHDVLNRSDALPYDPWLMASEIATSQLASQKSKHVRGAKRIFGDQDFSNFELSELKAAVATLELESGTSRHGRKLIRESVVEPNDNALAQFNWASSLGLTGVDIEELDIPKIPSAFEAEQIQLQEKSEWKKAVSACVQWQRDEPFSVRPASSGSFLATTMLGDAVLSQRFAEQGLQANPQNTLLRNNLIVALADQNRVPEASAEFEKLTKPTKNDESFDIYIATSGLIAFRSDQHDAGRELYAHAIENAERRKDYRLSLLARVFLAREEARINQETAARLVSEIEDKLKKRPDNQISGALCALKTNFMS